MSEVRTPVVFIHGLWLHATSWQPWMELFAAHGYEPVAPGWPGEAATVEECRAGPEAVAGKGINDVAEHFAGIIATLPAKPVLVGHSFGGLLVEKLMGESLGAAGVAIDPAQIKGVLPLPLAQLRSALPALGNPANRNRALMLTKKEFKYAFCNELTQDESDALWDAWMIPSPARPLFQAATANFNPHAESKVDTGNDTRGPLLFVSGLADHTVPDVTTRSAFKQYRDSLAITELKQFEGRGHSLTIDHGWREVAESVLGWLKEKGL